MNSTILDKVKSSLLHAAASLRAVFTLFLPRRLPQGSAEFEAWSTRLMSRYPLPTNDKDSIQFALAAMIINLGPRSVYKSDLFFILSLKAGAAKQVAGQVFADVKQKQKEAHLKKLAEATANQDGVASGGGQA